MRLEKAEPIKGERSGLVWKPSQGSHTHRIRHIACKVLRQIFYKVILLAVPYRIVEYDNVLYHTFLFSYVN